MFKQGENRINSMGSAVFGFLIYLFLFAYAENPDNGHDVSSDIKVNYELYSGTATIVEARQISFLNCLLPCAGNFRFNRVNETPELISFNSIILHKMIVLEKTGLLIKPLVNHRFYHQIHPSETDDPPYLS